MKFVKYLPLLLLCLLTACGEPSKSTLLSEVENFQPPDNAAKKDPYVQSELSSIRSSLSSTIILLKDDRQVEKEQLNEALIFAIMFDAKKVVKFLVEKGADVNAQGKKSGEVTPLIAAVVSKNGEDIVKFLIDKGANVNLGDKKGRKPLQVAVARDDLTVAKLLIEKGADVNARDDSGWTALYVAALVNNVDAAKLLIKKGAAVNVKDKDGQTPLYVAASSNSVNVAKLLIEKGMDVNAKDNDGQTPLYMTASFFCRENNNVPVAKLLVEKGAKINVKDKDGQTPLHAAAYRDDTAIAKFLLNRGADVNAKDDKGETPLFFAMRNNKAAMAKLLIEKGANVDAQNERGYTPLHETARKNNADAAKFLIRKGADVNAKDKNGQTPLHTAAENDSAKVATILLENGADINARDRGDRTPLYWARLLGKAEVRKILLGEYENEDTGETSNSSSTAASPKSSSRNYGFGTKEIPTPSVQTERTTKMETVSPSEYFDEEEDEEADSASETPKEEPKEKKTPTTKQSEEKGVPLPGYGTTTKSDDALKGILIDLTHARPKKELSTPSSSREKEEKNKYESGESQSKRLRRSIGSLSTTWNIGNIKGGNPVSPTTLYTTSIYISDNGGYEYGSRRAFVPPVRSSGSMPCYLCYYEGEFGVPEEGDYRFVGYAESVMLVGVNSGGKKMETVLYAFRPGQGFGTDVKCGKDWEPARFCGPSTGNDGEEVSREESKDKRLYKGSWLHLVPDKRYSIKIAFGTISGIMQARLGIQKKGRDTDDNFPLFTLEKVQFPVYHRRYPGAGYTTLESRKTGQYNTTCVFTPPQEQPTPTTKKTPATGTTKRKTSSKP